MDFRGICRTKIRAECHLADLVQRILSIAVGVLKIVMSGEGSVDVPGNDALLGRLLQHEDFTIEFIHLIYRDRVKLYVALGKIARTEE